MIVKWLKEERMTDMKRFITILLVIFTLLLCSCRPSVANVDTTDGNAETTVMSNDTEFDDTVDASVTEDEVPCFIGFYDDLENNGVYTRLNEWKVPWIIKEDIAVFDVIPSNEEVLTGSSYKDLWIAESEKVSNPGLVTPYFSITYTLVDGSEKSAYISSYVDAEAITEEGYIEIYLYDDIHQEEDAWYYHLTDVTTTEQSVISSIKLTAGNKINDVNTIKLTAFVEGSSSDTIIIERNGD